MRKLILLLPLILLACVTTATLTPAAIVTGVTPTLTAPPMLPSITPNWQATAERAQYLVTQEVASVERKRLEYDNTQAAHERSMAELNSARQHELDRTLTAAEAFAVVSRAQVEASATAAALQQTAQSAAIANTQEAQKMIITQALIISIHATQTADAPLAYIRQRAQLTELSAQATHSTDVKTMEASNAAYWRTFWRIAGVAAIGTALAFLWVLALSIDARRRERLINARASAARQRVINTSGGPTFAGDYGAQPIAQGNRPLVNLGVTDNGAGWAKPPEQETPKVEPMRAKAIKLLLDAAGVAGWDSKTIPSLDSLPGWNSDSERDEVIKWLAGQGAVYTRPGSGTFISAEYGDLRGLFQAVRG